MRRCTHPAVHSAGHADTRSAGPHPPGARGPGRRAAIPQNRAESGCVYHPFRGYGFQVAFRWLPSESSRGLAGYEVVARRVESANPAVNTFFPSPGGSTTMTWTSCQGFVADHNLEGWEWRVRARDAAGSVSDWSEPGAFRFEPCRISRRQPCSAPAP